MTVAHACFLLINIFLFYNIVFICQTILSMASSLSGMSSQKTSRELNQNHLSRSQEINYTLEASVPDGTQNPVFIFCFIIFWEITVVISSDRV